ncbi:MAG: hypothetical protein P1V97_24270 [Planctomycetota bacterium]|nr:hypothetical protein [Planctomycetota bacterium]
MSESLNDIVSRIVLEHGLATEAKLEKAIAKQKKIRQKDGRKESLERVLVDMGVLKGKQLKGLRYAVLYYLVRKVDRFYGKIAVQSDICEQAWVDQALKEQKRVHQKDRRLVRINKILLEKEYINSNEDRAILKAIDDIRNKKRKKKGAASKDRQSERLKLDEDDPDAVDMLNSALEDDDLELDGLREDDLDELNEVSGMVEQSKEVPIVDDVGDPEDNEMLTKSTDLDEDDLDLDDGSGLELDDEDDDEKTEKDGVDSASELEIDDDLEDGDDDDDDLDNLDLDDVDLDDDDDVDDLDDEDDLELDDEGSGLELDDDSDEVVLPTKKSKTSAKASKKKSAIDLDEDSGDSDDGSGSGSGIDLDDGSGEDDEDSAEDEAPKSKDKKDSKKAKKLPAKKSKDAKKDGKKESTGKSTKLKGKAPAKRKRRW